MSLACKSVSTEFFACSDLMLLVNVVVSVVHCMVYFFCHLFVVIWNINDEQFCNLVAILFRYKVFILKTKNCFLSKNLFLFVLQVYMLNW